LSTVPGDADKELTCRPLAPVSLVVPVQPANAESVTSAANAVAARMGSDENDRNLLNIAYSCSLDM